MKKNKLKNFVDMGITAFVLHERFGSTMPRSLGTVCVIIRDRDNRKSTPLSYSIENMNAPKESTITTSNWPSQYKTADFSVSHLQGDFSVTGEIPVDSRFKKIESIKNNRRVSSFK